MDAISETRTKLNKKYWILFSLLFLLAVALILPPLINMNRYQRRIASAISNAVGRPVHLSSVTLRLLPRPGLEISDFVVEEDPAFGSEPALRAQNVDASVRLSSLWRGRLEIGRISLDQPSVNIVRNTEGRWNIGTALLQASRIPNAPTAQRRASESARFPYIEASNARVNFKVGNEKKPFSFFNADFAMWLEHPDEWRIRLEAQPVRTDIDLDLSDTGLLRVEGSLKRAPQLGDMPIDLQAEWSNAPLGQIARLLFGEDTGWRGNLQVNADIAGSAFHPQFKTRLRVAGIHRQEFAPAEPFNVDATCLGAYQLPSHSVDGLKCFWPIGDGHLLLTGRVSNMDHPQPALQLQVQNVPASFGLSALRLIRNGFASSAEISGAMQGNLVYATEPVEKLSGDVVVNALTVRIPGLDTPLMIPVLHIAAEEGSVAPRRSAKKQLAVAYPGILRLENASISLGEVAPLSIAATFSRTGYTLHFNGDASLARLRPIAADLGLLSNTVYKLAPKGSANLDVSVRGPWLAPLGTLDNPALTSTTDGTLRLKNAEYQASYLPGPVEIISAVATISPTQVIWAPVSVLFHKVPATVSVTVPTACADPACVREFNLTAPELDAAALQSAILGAGEHGELLQELLARLDRNKAEWPPTAGTVHVGTFTLGSLTLRDASSSLRIQGRKVDFTSIDGHAFNGAVLATGSMDATGDAPHYTLDVQFIHANASTVSTMWHDTTATGIVSAEVHVELSGYAADDLTKSAQGTFRWIWTQGTLAGAPGALTHFDHWSANGSIQHGALVLEKSQVTKGATEGDVSGSISFDRALDLKVTPQPESARVARVTGQRAPR